MGRKKKQNQTHQMMMVQVLHT